MSSQVSLVLQEGGIVATAKDVADRAGTSCSYRDQGRRQGGRRRPQPPAGGTDPEVRRRSGRRARGYGRRAFPSPRAWGGRAPPLKPGRFGSAVGAEGAESDLPRRHFDNQSVKLRGDPDLTSEPAAVARLPDEFQHLALGVKRYRHAFQPG